MSREQGVQESQGPQAMQPPPCLMSALLLECVPPIVLLQPQAEQIDSQVWPHVALGGCKLKLEWASCMQLPPTDTDIKPCRQIVLAAFNQSAKPCRCCAFAGIPAMSTASHERILWPSLRPSLGTQKNHNEISLLGPQQSVAPSRAHRCNESVLLLPGSQMESSSWLICSHWPKCQLLCCIGWSSFLSPRALSC